MKTKHSKKITCKNIFVPCQCNEYTAVYTLQVSSFYKNTGDTQSNFLNVFVIYVDP